MAIRTVVTTGYGNGTFSGSIALIVTLGYAIAQPVVVTPTHFHILHGTRSEPYVLEGAQSRPYILNIKSVHPVNNADP